MSPRVSTINIIDNWTKYHFVAVTNKYMCIWISSLSFVFITDYFHHKHKLPLGMKPRWLSQMLMIKFAYSMKTYKIKIIQILQRWWNNIPKFKLLPIRITWRVFFNSWSPSYTPQQLKQNFWVWNAAIRVFFKLPRWFQCVHKFEKLNFTIFVYL